ncbi:hypothetical protein [Streptomyces boninensis]|uniref:hypothetical protein n=1 Tax=Streptomyces boninensis TaxID=2039455 RepID=UPI003B20C36F
MSNTPAADPRKQDDEGETQRPSVGATEPKAATKPKTAAKAKPRKPGATGATGADALVFDDPLAQQSSDDTDRGWGERPASTDPAADLARFLDEKPPHHI